jgi:glycerol uptake facilitator-like aquaporin
LGALVRGKIDGSEAARYWAAQVLGAITGLLVYAVSATTDRIAAVAFAGIPIDDPRCGQAASSQASLVTWHVFLAAGRQARGVA